LGELGQVEEELEQVGEELGQVEVEVEVEVEGRMLCNRRRHWRSRQR